MKVIDCIQMTPEWWEARRGVPTASKFDKILTPTGKPTTGNARRGYICELIADSIEQLPPCFSSQGPIRGTNAMQNGIRTEPEARRWYAIDHDAVQEVGFCLTDDGRFGCSPDSLIGPDGLLEIKCPEVKTHIAYMLDGGKSLLADYRVQCHGQLYVTGRKWVDLLSYFPGYRPVLVRVEPDAYTQRLREALEGFYVEYQAALRLVKDAA